MVHLKILLKNLPKKRKVYVVHFYVIYGWKKLYGKGLFQGFSQTALLYLTEKWNFMLDKKRICRCYPGGSF